MAVPDAFVVTGHVTRPALRRVLVPLLPVRMLRNAVLLAVVVSAVVAALVLLGLDGLSYYSTPLGVRGYHPAHRLLRPSGPVGQSFGVLGAALMLVPFAYMIGKRLLRKRATPTSLKALLELHVFCGIVGPVLTTFHTSLKFNGIVSVAYWSMVLVSLSGFLGRHLYVRMPRTIRGTELSRDDLESRIADLCEELMFTAPPELLEHVEQFERETAPAVTSRGAFGGFAARARFGRARRTLERALEAGGTADGEGTALVALVVERAWLQHRLASLHRTKQLFTVWHVFHLPLVYLMFVIVSLHVALALYLGYVPFRW